MMRASTRRKYLWAIFVAFFLYICLYPTKYSVKMDCDIHGTDPSVVWEFLADFNNMKKLNPTIIDFAITSESGNYKNWQYGVYYTEHLHFLPFIKNSANAIINVVPEKMGTYTISSIHTTCFIKKCLCLNSHSSFILSGESNATHVIEEVTYECPRLMSFFCHGEVMFQRGEIFKNLAQIYNTE